MSYTFIPYNKEIDKEISNVPENDCATLSNSNAYDVLEAMGYVTQDGIYGEYDSEDMAQRLEENQEHILDRHYEWLSSVVNRAIEKKGIVYVC